MLFLGSPWDLLPFWAPMCTVVRAIRKYVDRNYTETVLTKSIYTSPIPQTLLISIQFS